MMYTDTVAITVTHLIPSGFESLDIPSVAQTVTGSSIFVPLISFLIIVVLAPVAVNSIKRMIL